MRTAPPPSAPEEASGEGSTRHIHRQIELRFTTDLPAKEAGEVADRAGHLVSELATRVNRGSFARMNLLFDRLQELVVSASHSGDPRVLDWLIAQVDAIGTPVASADQRWNELIGPFYDTAGLERWLGVTRQRLSQRVKSGGCSGCCRRASGPRTSRCGSSHPTATWCVVCLKSSADWGRGRRSTRRCGSGARARSSATTPRSRCWRTATRRTCARSSRRPGRTERHGLAEIRARIGLPPT